MSKVVIDIGHSSSKEGATHVLSRQGENKWNWPVAREIKRIIEESGEPIEVVLLDRGAFGNSISRTCRHINSLKPSLVLSLHLNDSESNSASGVEVFHFPNSSRGFRAASFILKHIVKRSGLPNRGVKAATNGTRARGFVASVAAPACLVESFFCDNPHDCSVIEKKGGQDFIASCIAQGIIDYFG